MEVKTAGAIPLWMVHFLTENQIYKTSFSKYATAYRTIYEREKRRLSAGKVSLCLPEMRLCSRQ